MRQCAILWAKSGTLSEGHEALSLLIVAYLFLGGAGAGAFAILACIDAWYGGFGGAFFARAQEVGFVERRYASYLVKRGYVVSLVALLLGAVCLLADLGRPEIAYMLFTQPTLSYISVGTYSLTALLLCVSYLAMTRVFSLPSVLDRVKPVVLVFGFVAALFVMTYTGILLQSMTSIALWNSPLLLVLFFLSALSTGIALVMVCSTGLSSGRADSDGVHRLLKVDLATMVLEALVCAAYLAAVAGTELGAQSVERLLVGDSSAAFVGGFVLCGLVAPGAMNVISIKRSRDERMDLAIACLVLLGGFCLRLSLFEARIHSSM